MKRKPHRHASATAHLSSADPRLADLIERVGPCRLGDGASALDERNAFKALGQSIVSQQLSTKAAETIFGRVTSLGAGGEFPSPSELLALSDTALRGAGLSAAKVASLRDLATRVHKAELRLAELESLTDEDIIVALTTVRGIGRWTAEMFLMFRLVRPDVLPVGDLGIRKGFQKLFRMRALPEAPRMEKLARPWRPYRTVACWYLWRSLELKTVS
jgi:DNA-3-methyladenine glycosylase II